MFYFHRELSPWGPFDTQAFTHTHTHRKEAALSSSYLVRLLLFDQDGQVFLQGPDDVRRTLVGFTEQRHVGIVDVSTSHTFGTLGTQKQTHVGVRRRKGAVRAMAGAPAAAAAAVGIIAIIL